MSILDASLRKTWDSLRARKQVQDDFLDEVRLRNLRGIRSLRVAFDYPVSVIAGRIFLERDAATLDVTRAPAYRVDEIAGGRRTAGPGRDGSPSAGQSVAMMATKDPR